MKQDTKFVITAPADGLAPNGARPSAVTVITISSYLFSVWLTMIDLYNFIETDHVIQSSKWQRRCQANSSKFYLSSLLNAIGKL